MMGPYLWRRSFLLMLCITPLLNAQYVRINDADKVAPNGGMAPPTVLKSTLALYTDDARTHEIEGAVTIGALIGEDGQIKNMRVLKGLGFGLDEMALSSVQQWTFSPATRLGTPISVYAQIDVPFSLASANALRIGPGMTAPSPQYRVDPQYTEAARRAGYQGTVVVQLLVKKDGTVDIMRVIQGLGLGLTDNAMDALKQWKFTPGQKGGEAVDVTVNVEVNFNLRQKK
jgi:TonB family protein